MIAFSKGTVYSVLCGFLWGFVKWFPTVRSPGIHRSLSSRWIAVVKRLVSIRTVMFGLCGRSDFSPRVLDRRSDGDGPIVAVSSRWIVRS